MKNNEHLLISICVLTYNSSKLILETLESVKNQSYKDIELIICDDASSDDSVRICEKWIAKNKGCFIHAEVFINETNKGIAPTRNFAVKQAQGEWVKFLDSDDLLIPHAIESYVSAMNEKTHFIIGNYIPFDEKGEKAVEKNRITLPSLIFKKETFEQLGGFDERFPMLEDFPFFAKAKKAGYTFDWVDETVIYYRQHLGSIQRTPQFHLSHVNYVRQVVVPEYKKQKRHVDYWHDKLWSAKEIAKINQQPIKAFFIYLLMLISDRKEWYYILRDKIFRPLIFKYRSLKSKNHE
jgi:alpha-1,3-rhamnosyltransferase